MRRLFRLSALLDEVFVTVVLREARVRLDKRIKQTETDHTPKLQTEIQKLKIQIANLAEAVANGGSSIPALVGQHEGASGPLDCPGRSPCRSARGASGVATRGQTPREGHRWRARRAQEGLLTATGRCASVSGEPSRRQADDDAHRDVEGASLQNRRQGEPWRSDPFAANLIRCVPRGSRTPVSDVKSRGPG